MLPILQVGPFAVQTPGLILLAGIWLGLWLAERYSSKFQITGNQIYNLALISIGAGLIGARLFYVFRYPNSFIVSPSSAFSLNPGLLDPIAGAVTALLAAVIYGQRIKVPLLDTLDAITPFLAAMVISINLANLASGSAFGLPTEMPWGVELWGARRHPSQIYSLLASVGALGFVLWLLKREQTKGLLFQSFIAATAGSVLVLEAYRADSEVLIYGIRSAQVLAWFLLGVSLILIWFLSRTSDTETAT